jgi:hypothetical protein
MKRYSPAAILLAILTLTSPLAADDPPPTPVFKLDAPASVAIGDLATVTVNPASNVQDVQFLIAPACLNPLNVKTGPDFVSFVCGADCPKGGRFTVFAAANLNGKTVTAEAIVVFGQPPTPPGPNPPPNPTPPPGPAASHLWLISVYDTTAHAPDIEALTSDSAFWYSLQQRGHQFRFFDVQNAQAKPFVDAAAKLQAAPPFVLYMDADTKKVLTIQPLPQDKAAVTAEVNALTGKSEEN